jgi:transposase
MTQEPFMVNRLTMAKVTGILTLHQQGWSGRRIAEALGVDRKTVAEHLRAEASKRATAPPGEAPLGSQDSNWAKAPLGSERSDEPQRSPEKDAERVRDPSLAGVLSGSPPRDESLGPQPAARAAVEAANTLLPSTESQADDQPAGSRSACAAFREIIREKYQQGLTAQRIYQDLVLEQGFAGSYYSVRRFLAAWKREQPLPFRRLELAPGEEAQVDFGSGAPLITAEGGRRRCYVLRVVLSHSRKGYSEVVDRQTTENFVRALENALHAFGGAPRTLVIDNLRAAVQKADWFDPELNPKVRSFCEHYGVVLLPTRPYLPRHKGKVERGVAYVQDNALKGRTFRSLSEQNEFLRSWEETVADTRIHGTTRRQVGQLFREAERPCLRPLPAERFPDFQEGERRVHRDGHIEVARAYYSVPQEYLGREVWVRWNSRTVRIFNSRMEPIALHARQEFGRFSTHGGHIAAEKITGVERGAAWLLQKIRWVGPQTMRWAEAMLAERGIEGVRVLQGLLALTKKHPSAELEAACDAAWRHQAYRLRTLRTLLKRRTARQELLPLLDEHPLIRPLAEYGQFVHESIQGADAHA